MQSEGLPRVLLNSCWFIGLVKWQPLWLKMQLPDYWLELAVSTPVLTSLHSPLVYLRINYKTLLIAQKILCGHTVTPSYIFKPSNLDLLSILHSKKKKKKRSPHFSPNPLESSFPVTQICWIFGGCLKPISTGKSSPSFFCFCGILFGLFSFCTSCFTLYIFPVCKHCNCVF